LSYENLQSWRLRRFCGILLHKVRAPGPNKTIVLTLVSHASLRTYPVLAYFPTIRTGTHRHPRSTGHIPTASCGSRGTLSSNFQSYKCWLFGLLLQAVCLASSPQSCCGHLPKGVSAQHAHRRNVQQCISSYSGTLTICAFSQVLELLLRRNRSLRQVS
jgi:hypothetical protein